MAAFRVASAQYDIGTFRAWADYEAKAARWVAEAADAGARLLVFPEYFSMELASLFPVPVQKSLSGQLEALQELLPAFQSLFAAAARRHGVHIVAGTYPVRQPDGGYRNRAYLFYPDGYWRVRIGCQARALENQCYVVQSPTVGLAPWSEAVDVNIGAAAIYTPVDYGFPDNGVLAIGELNATQWVYADIDLASIANIRQTGQVFNYRDWPLQERCLGASRTA